MAARKTIKTKTGAARAATSANTNTNVQVPVNTNDLVRAVEQLQETVNELIVRHNTHQHAALNAAPSTNTVTGTAQTDAGLFTP